LFKDEAGLYYEYLIVPQWLGLVALMKRWLRGADGLALLRSKGSNVNKPFDVRIIVSNVRKYHSTI